jgi:hypothetical protein
MIQAWLAGFEPGAEFSNNNATPDRWWIWPTCSMGSIPALSTESAGLSARRRIDVPLNLLSLNG